MLARFIAIDVETANHSRDSICAIGIARFCDAKAVDEWYTLVNPEDFFHPVNKGIHGISEKDIERAPTFPDALERCRSLIEDSIVVSHTAFDRVSMQRAAQKYSIELPDCRWVDSASIARRVWPEISRSGYGLANVCDMIGYEFQHHNALEDAKAAGQVLLAAIERSGKSIDELSDLTKKKAASSRKRKPIKKRKPISVNVNPSGALLGEVVVFTGRLTVPRREAAMLAANAGCNVSSNVTNSTTMLVVGDQDIRRLAGHDISSKHRRALSHIEKGIAIEIVGETDFMSLLSIDLYSDGDRDLRES